MKKVIERILVGISIIAMILGIFVFLCYRNVDDNGTIRFNKFSIVDYKDDIYIINNSKNKDYRIGNNVGYYITSKDSVIAKVGKLDDGYSNLEMSNYIFTIKDGSEKYTVYDKDMIGIVKLKLSKFSLVFDFLISRLGFLIICVVPLIILFIFEFIYLIMDYIKMRKD